MRKLKNKIICIVGESGSGKTTLYNLLREEGYDVVDSYTTRLPRTPDELGHIFVNQDQFEAIRGDLAAYTEFDKHEYGTTFEQLDNSDFYIIDPAGVQYLTEKIERDSFVIVYVSSSLPVRYQRLKKDRGEADALNRLHHDQDVFHDFITNREWDYIIENDHEAQLKYCIHFLTRLYHEISLEK